MQRRVLIAARDVALRAGLARVLGHAGYAFELAEGPKRAREIVDDGNVALAIVEPHGFGNAGLELMRELRRAIGGLIVIAESPRDVDQLKKIGLQADAYVSQPIDSGTILERVTGLLGKPESGELSPTAPKILVFEGYALDLAGRSLRDPSGQNVPITAAQFALLAVLASRPGQVFSRDQISEAIGVRDREITSYDRSIDVLISRLRRKIEPDPKAPRFIITVSGAGYKFAARAQIVTTPELKSSLIEPHLEPATLATPIGVIPFNVIGTDQDCSIFALGLTEDLITFFLQSGFVVSQVKFASGHTAPDLRRLAPESSYLVTGSVRRTEKGLRVTAQLLQTESGHYLWAEHYDLSPNGLLAVQDTISEKIATGVRGAVRDGRVGGFWPRQLERRQLTIISCEFTGIARLAGLDPEDLQALIASFHRCCTETIGRFGGVVVRFAGDLMLACFGYPQAQEHDAEQAVRAGFALIDEISKLDAAPAGLRLGIATGPVVVGDLIGRGSPEDGGVIGEARNLAAALCRIAEPGTIVIATSTRRLIGELFDCRELGGLDLDGFDDGTPTWEVLHPSSVDSRFEALHGSSPIPIVGREEELELLFRNWQLAKSGDMRVVLVTGEEGIGKSRLAVALQDRISAESNICLRYFCSPHHQDSALYPVIRQLEKAAGFERNDAPEIRLDKLTTLLAPLTPKQDLPLLAELLALPAQPSPDPTKFRPRIKKMIFEALIRQLDGIARQRPVLMIFEDAHWSDPTSRELLDLVIERLARRPVLLVITCRTEFVSPSTGKAHVTTLTLNRLPRRDSIALIHRVIGNDTLPSDIVNEIAERTDGVPLFLEELSKAVLETNCDWEEPALVATSRLAVTIPATLQASLMARLDNLDSAAKEMAQIAAAIGREFSYELVAAVARRPDTEISKGLEGLVKSGLAFGRGVLPDATFLFKHALVRDAAYETLPKSRRQQLHGQIARTMEEKFPDIVVSQPEIVAHHFTEAGLVEPAIEYWLKAGNLALTRFPNVAVGHLKEGLKQIPNIEEPALRNRYGVLLETSLGNSLRATKGWSTDSVKQAYTRALELGKESGLDEQTLPAVFGLWTWNFVRAALGEAQTLAEHLLNTAEDVDNSVYKVLAHEALGFILFAQGKFAAAHVELERSISLCEDSKAAAYLDLSAQDPRVHVRSYDGMVLWFLGYPDQALRICTEARRYADASQDPFSQAMERAISLRVHQFRGEAEIVASQANAAIAHCEEYGFAHYLAIALMLRGWAIAQQGEFEKGIAEIQEGLEKERATGALLFDSYSLGLLADACIKNKRYEQALEFLHQAQLRLDEKNFECFYAAEIYRLLGEAYLRSNQDLDKAEHYFSKGLKIARKQKAKSLELKLGASIYDLYELRQNAEKYSSQLGEIYGFFSEGFDTTDLVRAKARLKIA